MALAQRKGSPLSQARMTRPQQAKVLAGLALDRLDGICRGENLALREIYASRNSGTPSVRARTMWRESGQPPR